MTKEKVNLADHLNVYKVIKNGAVKRFEISAENGYVIYRKDDKTFEFGLLMYPAKTGLENVINNIEIKNIDDPLIKYKDTFTSDLIETLSETLSEITGESYTDFSFEQLIEIISNLNINGLNDLRLSLENFLPNMHFDKMTDNQFKYAVELFYNSYLNLGNYKIISTSWKAEIDDETGELILNEAGNPLIIYETVILYDENEYELKSIEGENNVKTPISESIGSPITAESTIEEMTDRISEMKENEAYFQGIIDAVEEVGTIDALQKLTSIATSTHKLKLPYIYTSNFDFNGNYIWSFNNIEEVGFHMADRVWNNTAMARIAMDSIKKLIVTNNNASLSSTINAPNYMFYAKGITTIEELYTDGFSVRKGNILNRYFESFKNCTNLRIIGGFNPDTRKIDNENWGAIDFVGATDIDSMFANCISLEEVRFVPDSLSGYVSLAQSYNLSEDSTLSIINSMNSTAPASVALNAGTKFEMENNRFCKLNSETNLYEKCNAEDEDAISQSDAVAMKGWGLS
ncbi:MAG: hypothetical protein KBT46_00530 [Ruminococcus sp.]|nr:hypothetical protein [Candidatus Copronaster equi]